MSDSYKINNIKSLFPRYVKKYWLEIGFGSGENIKWQLQHNSEVGFIACEPYLNGIASLLEALNDEELKRIKIYMGDVNTILPIFKKNIFEKVFILFPDPWPKKRQNKRRIIQSIFLNKISRVMEIGGELRIACDDYSYVCWIMKRILDNKSLVWEFESVKDIVIKPSDLANTKYQIKADLNNRQSYYFKLKKEN